MQRIRRIISIFSKAGEFVGRIVNPTVRNAIPHYDTPK